jgi:hypothetical protein
MSLLQEAKVMGWEKSSLAKLFGEPTESRRADWFYFMLYLSNFYTVLGVIGSFSLGILLNHYVLQTFDLALLKKCTVLACINGSIDLGFIYVLLGTSFISLSFSLGISQDAPCIGRNDHDQ